MMSLVPRLILLAWLAIGSIAAGSEMPRYRLDVGRGFIFTGSTLFVGETSQFSESQIWTVWVVRKNPDGSSRLLIHNENRLTPETKKGIATGDTSRESSIAYMDIFEDGRGEWNPTMGRMLDPSRLFPPLPQTAEQVRDGWSRTMPDGEVWSYRSGVKDAKRPTIQATRTTPWDKIYDLSWKETITFDTEVGAIDSLRRDDSQGFGFEGTGVEEIKLAAVTTLPEGRKPEQVAEDAMAYFAARATFDEQVGKARVADDPEAIARVGIVAMQNAGAKVGSRLIRDQIFADLERHEKESISAYPWASELAATVGKPAFAFAIDDLKDKRHAIQDYRGKVVVLHFWNRETPWCMKTLPKIMAMRNDLRDEPVVVLGMNTDPNENDAWFVVHSMGLNFPTLKADETASAMNISACPVTIVIDREGNVARIQVGYDRSMKDDLSQTIRGLLQKKGT